MMACLFLSLEEVLALHEISLHEFGGSSGIRDLGLIESSLGRPQQTFAGADLYPEIWDKAAALAHSIAENQPFVDGNKRTAALSMLVFLDLNGQELHVPEGEIYKVMIKLADQSFSRADLAAWLKRNCKLKTKAN